MSHRDSSFHHGGRQRDEEHDQAGPMVPYVEPRHVRQRDEHSFHHRSQASQHGGDQRRLRRGGVNNGYHDDHAPPRSNAGHGGYADVHPPPRNKAEYGGHGDGDEYRYGSEAGHSRHKFDGQNDVIPRKSSSRAREIGVSNGARRINGGDVMPKEKNYHAQDDAEKRLQRAKKELKQAKYDKNKPRLVKALRYIAYT